MAIPSSGVIKLSQIITEFRGPNNLDAYYPNGKYVVKTAQNFNIDSGNKLTIRSFAGAAYFSGTSQTTTYSGQPTPGSIGPFISIATNQTLIYITINTNQNVQAIFGGSQVPQTGAFNNVQVLGPTGSAFTPVYSVSALSSYHYDSSGGQTFFSWNNSSTPVFSTSTSYTVVVGI